MRSLPPRREVVLGATPQTFRDHAEVISRRLRYLIISRMAMSHQGSAPWIMHNRSSGKRMQTRSRWIGFWTSPGIGGPDAGVHAQRQVRLAALRVERVVDRVAGRVHAVAPEARPDDGVDDRVVAHERCEAAQRGIGRRRLKPPTPSENRSGRSHAKRWAVGALPLLSIFVSRIARSTPLASMSSSSSASSGLRGRSSRL